MMSLNEKEIKYMHFFSLIKKIQLTIYMHEPLVLCDQVLHPSKFTCPIY